MKRPKEWGAYQRWLQYREIRNDDGGRWRERDPEDNHLGRLPIGESLEVPAVWVVELYTPSTISGLLDGISHLGWDRGRIRADSLVKWMVDVRNGLAAGWTSLGVVSSVDDRHFAADRFAVLPPGTRAVLPTLMSVTPSITALVACFMLTDERAQLLNEPLRADYATYVERDDRFRRRHVLPYLLWKGPIHLGHSYHTPHFQRRDKASQLLDDLEQDCTRWVNKNLPGAFAGGLRGGLHPTAMLFVSKDLSPLTTDAAEVRALDGTGLDQHYDTWQSEDWPECRMTLPRARRKKEELRLRFGARRSDAFPDDPGFSNPQSNWTVTQRANDRIPALVVRWALSCLLDGYHQLVSSHRDRSALNTSYRPIQDVRDLRKLVRADIYDLLSAASEVPSFADSKWEYAFEVLDVEHVHPVSGEKTRLIKEFRSRQKWRARQVERDARLLLSTLSTSTELTKTISGIRIQRFLVLLTTASIAVALVAIFLSLNPPTP